MRVLGVLLLTACGFTHGSLGSPGDGGGDATDSSESMSCMDWWNAGWTARRDFTVHSSQVVGTQTAFTIPLVLANDADLHARARSDASDVQIVDADGTTVLPSEIELYDAASGTIIVWVNVPRLANTDPDRVLHMYYGGQSVAPMAGVWPSHTAVWHLSELRDSVGQHGATGPLTAAPGHLGNAMSCDGVTNGLDVASFARGAAFTLEAWINTNAVTTGVFYAVVTNWTQDNRWFGLQGSLVDFYDGSTDHTVTANITTSTWTHIAVTYDATNVRIYENGTQLGAAIAASYTAQTSPMQIGYNPNPGALAFERFTGFIDEVRASPMARSPAYLQTEVASTANPSMFAAPGALAHCP